jgi:hypothetical protein
MYIPFVRNFIHKFKNSRFNCFPQFIRTYSQFGEDIFLRHYFGNRKGFYVDFGAYHPFRFSNTAYLYRRGWRGLNIDARPGSKKVFDFWRKKDINIEAMVGDGKDVKYKIDSVDASMNTASDDGVVLKTQTPMDIITRYAPNQKIDLISIDVESMNFIVLKNIDLTVVHPEIVIYESGEENDKGHDYLEKMGYALIAKTLVNKFFKRRN